MPDGVRRIPPCASSEICSPAKRSWASDTLSRRGGSGGGGQSSSSSRAEDAGKERGKARAVVVEEEDEGRSVSCEGEGESDQLLLCFSADSGGSGVSSRYLRVVEGSMAIVSMSVFGVGRAGFLARGGSLRFEDERFIMIAPSSESLSSLSPRPSEGYAIASSSSSSPFISSAMHCSTCSLKWMCFLSVPGDVTPELVTEGSTLVFSRLSRRDASAKAP